MAFTNLPHKTSKTEFWVDEQPQIANKDGRIYIINRQRPTARFPPRKTFICVNDQIVCHAIQVNAKGTTLNINGNKKKTCISTQKLCPLISNILSSHSTLEQKNNNNHYYHFFSSLY